MFFPNMFTNKTSGPRPTSVTQAAAPGLKFTKKPSSPANSGQPGSAPQASNMRTPNSQTAALRAKKGFTFFGSVRGRIPLG